MSPADRRRVLDLANRLDTGEPLSTEDLTWAINQATEYWLPSRRHLRLAYPGYLKLEDALAALEHAAFNRLSLDK